MQIPRQKPITPNQRKKQAIHRKAVEITEEVVKMQLSRTIWEHSINNEFPGEYISLSI